MFACMGLLVHLTGKGEGNMFGMQPAGIIADDDGSCTVTEEVCHRLVVDFQIRELAGYLSGRRTKTKRECFCDTTRRPSYEPNAGNL